MRLYVSNLPWATTEDELKAIFEAHGKVLTCEIVRDRETDRSRGFGFVTFDDEAGARRAIESLNEREISSVHAERARPRRIRVEIAKSKPALRR